MDKTNQSSTSPPGSTQEHALIDDAGALIGEARHKGTEQFEHYRDNAADQLDSLEEGARSAAAALQGNDSLGLSQYLNQAAECVGEFAEQVRHESAESLLQRGAQLARSNPALFWPVASPSGLLCRASCEPAPAMSPPPLRRPLIGNSPAPRSQCLIVVATYPPVNLSPRRPSRPRCRHAGQWQPVRARSTQRR